MENVGLGAQQRFKNGNHHTRIANAKRFNGRRLEKSIGEYDLTHNFKLGAVYELPFGRGKLRGGWRLSSSHYYSSGAPVLLNTSIQLPLAAGRQAPTITTYEGWRGPLQPQQGVARLKK